MAPDRDALLALLAREQVDVVLSDIRMPTTHTDEGLQVARKLLQHRSKVGVILLSQYVQPRPWRFWFGEALVHILVLCTILADSARFRAVERRRPLATALVMGGITGGVALGAAALWGRPPIPLGFEFRTEYVAWFFALGWVVARAQGAGVRLALSAFAVLVMPRFFDQTSRGVFVAVGIVALVWVATIPLPAVVARTATVVAAASLAIYLVHYEDLYPYAREWSPWIVTLAGIAAGVAVHELARVARRRLSRSPGAPASRVPDAVLVG